MTDLAARNVAIAGRLGSTDFTLSPGELVAIVGPNGSGKSSLLRILAGLLRPDSGTVSLDNLALESLDPLTRARALAYLPQHAEVAWPILVADMVALGRYAFGAEDMKRNIPAGRWLEEVGCEALAGRSTATLSGGELALVALARIFAAETPLLLLDEPTAALDPKRQIDTMARLAKRSREGRGIAIVLHDLNLAAQFADRIVWMKDGRIEAETPPEPAALTANAAAIFGVEVRVEVDDDERVRSVAICGGSRND